VQKDIEKKTQHNILNKLEIEEIVEKIDTNKSIIFLSGNNDSMINKDHS
jgi:hypothetical protein